ncbi:MAG: MarR family winged helix-turn-helix transcriptional regulator [Anaerovoracaceae bacterium]|jgi:DNA-binding MarR family transcriptional regulator
MGKRIDNTTCHCLKMRRSAGNVIRFYDNILSPSGVTVRQYSLLNKIAENEGCSVRELSDAAELDRSTLARSLKPLMKAGYIEDRKEKSARNSVLYLTEEGVRTCDHAEKLWQRAQKEFEDKIGDSKVKELESILELFQTL